MKRARRLSTTGVRIAAVLICGLSSLLILGAMIMTIASLRSETTFVGYRGGPWQAVSTWQVQVGVLVLLVPLTAWLLYGTTATLGRLAILALAQARSHPAGLALGEPIVWQGRQGWRGFSLGRLSFGAMGAIGPALFLIIGWHIWSGADTPAMKLFWTAATCIVLGGSVAMALITGPRALRRCYLDLFGTMVVTDRRIVWLSPLRRHVYDEVEGTELIDAALVESTRRRGWITIVRRAGADVRSIDVKGVPRPASALAALSRLIRPPLRTGA